MSMHVRRQYQPLVVAASSTTDIKTSAIGGFFATGAGTVTINGTTDRGDPIVIVPAFIASAGVWYELPFFIGARGGTIVTGVGAAGVLAT